MKLYEAYKNRLAVADQVFAKAHEGAHMDANRQFWRLHKATYGVL